MARDVIGRIGQFARFFLLFLMAATMASEGLAAPYAAMVIDARSGEVLHSRNADTQLHPASLTKMMTLYVAFEAIENGEISLDTMVTISAKAASEPPSKVGFAAGSKVRLRYLIRAAAVKSANDAATAIGEAISGSEAAFARRMNRTAKAIGMSRTNFKNAHGLTEAGHMSTARDMTELGRHLFYDYPDYYNLFSRLSTKVGGKELPNTNRRFLNAYQGADGIKTGYTRAAGFNLVASAERGNERIITTVFGGQSTASRNAKVAELMDMGFKRAPSQVAVRRPAKPPYLGNQGIGAGGTMVASLGPDDEPGGAGKTIRIVAAPTKSPRPKPRPAPEPVLTAELAAGVDQAVANVMDNITAALKAEALAETAQTPTDTPVTVAAAAPTERAAPKMEAQVIAASATAPMRAPQPPARPNGGMILTKVDRAPDVTAPEPTVVTRMSTSGGRHYGINVGLFTTKYEAERVLLKTALTEISTLGEALRKVGQSRQGWKANFVGMTKDGAELACRRLQARAASCTVIEAGAG